MTTTEKIKLLDAFNNSGLPQLAERVRNDETPTKQEIKEAKQQINNNDNYYLKGWKNSKDRDIIKNYINNFVVAYRCYSLIIE